jgi:hypothetical protein
MSDSLHCEIHEMLESHLQTELADFFGAHPLRAGFLTSASARRGVPKAEGWTDRLTSWRLSLPIIANDHLKDE